LVPKDLSCRDEGVDDGGFAPTIPITAEPNSRSDIWKEDISASKLFRKNFGRKGTEGGSKISAKGKEDEGAEHQSLKKRSL
jgi:hypothetical protein